jgi:hypothetical protein
MAAHESLRTTKLYPFTTHMLNVKQEFQTILLLFLPFKIESCPEDLET